MMNFNASADGAPTQDVPNENGMPKNGIFETQKASTAKETQTNGEKVK